MFNLGMTDKPALIGVVRTRLHFEGESSHWLVWVWEIHNFFNWILGWIWGCKYLSRPRTRHNVPVSAIILHTFYYLFLLIVLFVIKFIWISNIFFHLIIAFMQLCSNDVCQLNIFYVSHLNIYSFLIFIFIVIFLSHDNV